MTNSAYAKNNGDGLLGPVFQNWISADPGLKFNLLF
jgi:hypothetical protein